MNVSTFIKLGSDDRYDYGFVVYNRKNRRKDELKPIGTADTYAEAERSLAEYTNDPAP